MSKSNKNTLFAAVGSEFIIDEKNHKMESEAGDNNHSIMFYFTDNAYRDVYINSKLTSQSDIHSSIIIFILCWENEIALSEETIASSGAVG